ncbi:MAG: MBL fold metallo-hydrolase [Myxococcales bacterium]|nr:MBL fold metallo-hydrolase [Myxococcales bacterium]
MRRLSSGKWPAVGRPQERCECTQLVFPELNLTIEGVSVAGVETWLRIPEWGLGIDTGRSPDSIVRCRHIALTHAHMDHAGGLGQILALRKLWSLGPCTVYAPAPSCADLASVVCAWQRLHGVEFDWSLVPMESGCEADIGGGRRLRALAADHVVPALGYAIVSHPRKLRPEFAGLDGDALRQLQEQGTEVTAPQRRVLLAASGDTLAGALERSTELQEADVLLHEATFLDERRTRDDAHKGGHTHLDELIERAQGIQARHFVPYHVSQIYSADEARRVLSQRIPPDLLNRTTALLPGERVAPAGYAGDWNTTGQFPTVRPSDLTR